MRGKVRNVFKNRERKKFVLSQEILRLQRISEFLSLYQNFGQKF